MVAGASDFASVSGRRNVGLVVPGLLGAGIEPCGAARLVSEDFTRAGQKWVGGLVAALACDEPICIPVFGVFQGRRQKRGSTSQSF